MTERALPTDTTTAKATDQVAQPARVLGDLLKADPATPRIPEQEWVEIVRAMAAGDQAALHAIYERSHRPTFSLIMRITHDRATAEELTVDVYHDVWRRAAEYDPANGTVLGWIMNQARSRALDRLRYEKRQKRVNPFPHDPLDGTGDGDLEENIDRDELAARLQSASGVLTPEERQVLVAAFFSGMTHAEIADQAGTPLGTIKTRIRSALAKLRRQMAAGKEAS